MTVAELIDRLREFDEQLPVRIADWNEEYSAPHECGAATFNVDKNGQAYVCLGIS